MLYLLDEVRCFCEMEAVPMKKPMVKISVFLGIAVSLGLVLRVAAESLTVVVSPDNNHPKVKYYSNVAGELHSLTVQPAPGYKLSDPPTLELNPDGLWTALDAGSFGLANMGGRAQHSAMVAGSLVPIGAGGGGAGAPIPFDVNMLSHYFTISFFNPSPGMASVDPGSQVGVSVILANAVGAPASGSVNFSSGLGTFTGGGTVVGGMASSTLTVTGSVGMQDAITANAFGVDITGGETASGTAQSSVLEVAQTSVPDPVITLLLPEDAVQMQ